jgi:SAM-dependent methyltransferase
VTGRRKRPLDLPLSFKVALRRLASTVSHQTRRRGWLQLPPRDHVDVAVKPIPYLEIYERVLAPFRYRRCSILELGVWGGDSLAMWRNGLPRATIVGLDLEPPDINLGPRVRIVRGDQTDAELLRHIREEHAPDGFDVIIDDASHMGVTTARSLQGLYRDHLRSGGVYCIEDWGTGYLPDWPDGQELAGVVGADELDRSASAGDSDAAGPVHLPSHDVGMVGLVKRLVDHVAAGTTLAHLASEHVGDALMIAALEIYDGVIVLRKP